MLDVAREDPAERAAADDLAVGHGLPQQRRLVQRADQRQRGLADRQQLASTTSDSGRRVEGATAAHAFSSKPASGVLSPRAMRSRR